MRILGKRVPVNAFVALTKIVDEKKEKTLVNDYTRKMQRHPPKKYEQKRHAS